MEWLKARPAQLTKLKGPNYQHKFAAGGPQKFISFRCRDFVAVWKKFWNDNCLFEITLLQHFHQLKKLSQTARKAFAGHMLCKPAQSQ